MNKFFWNYWDDYTNLKIYAIRGTMWYFTLLYVIGIVKKAKTMNWYNFDWFPAKEPYDL